MTTIAKREMTMDELASIPHPTNYPEALVLALGCARYFKNDSDIMFIESLPQEEDEYRELPQHTKDVFMKICLTHIAYFKNNGEIDLSGTDIEDAHDEVCLSMANKYDIMAQQMRSLHSKKDYPTYWECALDIRLKIVTGDGLPKDMEIYDGYRWAVDNCTVKGKPIEHRNKLINGYDNAKKKTKSAVIIGKFEEDNYD